MKKYHWIILSTVLLIPLGITLIFHFANYLYQVHDININLKGIAHVEWFMFLGSFSGGVCTVFAFILSDNSNSKNLNKSIDAGQKQQTYQARIKAIEEEEKVIASAIAELNLGTGNIYFNMYRSALSVHNGCNSEATLYILNSIIEHRKTLSRNNTLLSLKTNILCVPCKHCGDFLKSPQNEFASEFFKIYKDTYITVFTSLGYAYDGLFIASKNMVNNLSLTKAELNLSNNIEKLNDHRFACDELKALIEENIKLNNELIERIKSSIEQEKEDYFFKKMKEYKILGEEIEETKIPQMLDASRKYIECCKAVAKEEMEGKIFPKCTKTISIAPTNNTANIE